MLLYLEASTYRLASREEQKAMRLKALLPQDPDAEMPDAYRIWRMCRDSNTLWWPGGLANQPHIQLLEFAVCSNAYNQYHDEEMANVKRILSDHRV